MQRRILRSVFSGVLGLNELIKFCNSDFETAGKVCKHLPSSFVVYAGRTAFQKLEKSCRMAYNNQARGTHDKTESKTNNSPYIIEAETDEHQK